MVNQMRGERNFHIFYQMLGGLNDQLMNELMLTQQLGHYQYLEQGDCVGVDESKQFSATREALEVIPKGPGP